MTRRARPPSPRRCATALACSSLALALAAAPLQAQASNPAGMSPTAAKLRTIMTLTQDPDDVAPAGEAPVEAVPVAEGPAPVAQPMPMGPAPAPMPMGPEPSKGLGMMITGAAITGGFALPMLAYGAFVIVASHRYDDGQTGVQGLGTLAGGIIMAFGVIGLGVGAPLLGVGAYRFSRYQKWKRGEQVWSPSMNRTAHGTWTTGVTLRF